MNLETVRCFPGSLDTVGVIYNSLGKVAAVIAGNVRGFKQPAFSEHGFGSQPQILTLGVTHFYGNRNIIHWLEIFLADPNLKYYRLVYLVALVCGLE